MWSQGRDGWGMTNIPNTAVKHVLETAGKEHKGKGWDGETRQLRCGLDNPEVNKDLTLQNSHRGNRIQLRHQSRRLTLSCWRFTRYCSSCSSRRFWACSRTCSSFSKGNVEAVEPVREMTIEKLIAGKVQKTSWQPQIGCFKFNHQYILAYKPQIAIYISWQFPDWEKTESHSHCI